MKNLIIYTTAILCFTVIGCENISKHSKIDNETTTLKTSETNSINANKPELNDSTKSFITDFLIWYKRSYYIDSLDQNYLVPASLDTIYTDIYSVDFEKADRYIKVLHNSGFFDEGLLHKINAYLKECNESMYNYKITDGAPIGLDFDLILLTQEIQNSFNLIPDSISHISTLETGNEYIHNIKLTYDIEFRLKNEQGKFLIVNINDKY
jgi:hypothetical protein